MEKREDSVVLPTQAEPVAPATAPATPAQVPAVPNNKCPLCNVPDCSFHTYYASGLQAMQGYKEFHKATRSEQWSTDKMDLTLRFITRTLFHNIEMMGLMEEANILDTTMARAEAKRAREEMEEKSKST
jgi:hypothetical protein